MRTITIGSRSGKTNFYYEQVYRMWLEQIKDPINATIDKWIVLSSYGVFKGAWHNEEHAANAVKKLIKENPTSTYLIAKATQQISALTPELEVEKIN